MRLSGTETRKYCTMLQQMHLVLNVHHQAGNNVMRAARLPVLCALRRFRAAQGNARGKNDAV